MSKLSKIQQSIISIILETKDNQSSDIHEKAIKSGFDVSLVTIKRALSQMVKGGFLLMEGSGRSVRYNVSVFGRVFFEVDAKKYCSLEPDKRYGLNGYNFELFDSFPVDIFEEAEIEKMDNTTEEYRKRTEDLPDAIQKKELERLIIELSWKSSKIEGNTYTLLDTEKLILENKEAAGHDKKEAFMILNHKYAFNFIRENIEEFKALNKINLEKLHSILIKDLGVGFGLRNSAVGVTGSKYRPLDNIYQIQEALELLIGAVSKAQAPYAKALLAIVGISYIQPFEDGNKRTARLMANALLMANGRAPLSYRSVDESEYREAMLVFYEINSIVPFRKIFVEQYEFAAGNYAVKTAIKQ